MVLGCQGIRCPQDTQRGEIDLENESEQPCSSQENCHALFDLTALQLLIAEKKKINASSEDKELSYLKRMRESEWFRPTRPVPENYREIAHQVMEDAPNFSQWIEDFL